MGNGDNSSVTKQQVANMLRSVKLSKTVKWLDTNLVSSCSSSGTFTNVTSLATGNTNGTRVGTKILPLKLKFRIVMVLADTTNVFRIIIFRWKMNNGSDAPSQSELLTLTTDPMSNSVPLKPSRFKIIKDHTVVMDVSHTIRFWETSIPLSGDITYDPSVNTGIDHLYVYVMSDSSAAPHPSFDYDCQLQYLDD
jgi:hypothetical protein